jgi:hypothetical protein
METNIMLSSRKLLRREFLYMFPFKIFAAVNYSSCCSDPPERRFELGDYVISKRICNDHLSANYGGWDWESGFIVGYCWNYDEWLNETFQYGWTYFVHFEKTNNSKYITKPWIDFEHEINLAIA